MVRKKILLVDDSKTTLFMEKMLLKNGPYDLLLANDGVEGVDTATAEMPDLILMDMMMPRMTGIEAARALRACNATKHIPIIMVTTRGEGDNVDMGLAAGCDAYLTKPINGTALLAKVRSLLADGAA